MNGGYFGWLLDKEGVDDSETGYSYLCSVLHEIPFYAVIEMDENRWHDGIRLRDEFGLDDNDDFLGGCTAMELILSMAEKLYFEMLDSQYEAGVGKWFEELIGNLGLDIYTNRELMENEHAYFEIDGIVNKFIARRYSWNGEGGLFPLQYPKEDQRHVELIIQMNNYIAENYDILS